MSGRTSIVDGVVTHPLSEQRADELYLRRDGLNKMLADILIEKNTYQSIMGGNDTEPISTLAGSYVKLYEPVQDMWMVMIHDANYPIDFWVKKAGDAVRNPMFYQYDADNFVLENIVCKSVKAIEATGITNFYSTGAGGGWNLSAILTNTRCFEIPRAGDIEHILDSVGPILIDRTTATKYRLKVDNGVLGIEAV